MFVVLDSSPASVQQPGNGARWDLSFQKWSQKNKKNSQRGHECPVIRDMQRQIRPQAACLGIQVFVHPPDRPFRARSGACDKRQPLNTKTSTLRQSEQSMKKSLPRLSVLLQHSRSSRYWAPQALQETQTPVANAVDLFADQSINDTELHPAMTAVRTAATVLSHKKRILESVRGRSSPTIDATDGVPHARRRRFR